MCDLFEHCTVKNVKDKLRIPNHFDSFVLSLFSNQESKAITTPSVKRQIGSFALDLLCTGCRLPCHLGMGLVPIFKWQGKWQMYSNETLPLPLTLTLDAPLATPPDAPLDTRCGYALRPRQESFVLVDTWYQVRYVYSNTSLSPL